MITFVVYDDIKEFREQAEQLIQKICRKEKIEYKIESYAKYTSEFKKTIENNQIPKIYLLDIEVPESESGIDVAKKIRKKDWNSVIILITTHKEAGYDALKAKIMLLDFIYKLNDWKNNLVKTVGDAIRKIGKSSIITFDSEGVTHRLYVADILYVLKENGTSKCTIKTEEHEFSITNSLIGVRKLLDDRFYLSHKSCYVNLEEIKEVDWKKNIIYFGKGIKTDYLARDRRKGLKEYVRSS